MANGYMIGERLRTLGQDERPERFHLNQLNHTTPLNFNYKDLVSEVIIF